uniref:Uncharacterized protein n=1 Tax=Arundo donax TaxID=35708 RepID=A0A0A9H108_ARUDO
MCNDMLTQTLTEGRTVAKLETDLYVIKGSISIPQKGKTKIC